MDDSFRPDGATFADHVLPLLLEVEEATGETEVCGAVTDLLATVLSRPVDDPARFLGAVVRCIVERWGARLQARPRDGFWDDLVEIRARCAGQVLTT
jgi:hypothetical protein